MPVIGIKILIAGVLQHFIVIECLIERISRQRLQSTEGKRLGRLLIGSQSIAYKKTYGSKTYENVSVNKCSVYENVSSFF